MIAVTQLRRITQLKLAFQRARSLLEISWSAFANLVSKNWFHIVFFLPFIVPISLLYVFNPGLFYRTWKGRTLYLLFLWLLLLEFILARDKLPRKEFVSFKHWRTLVLTALAAAPTIYVIITNLGPYVVTTNLGSYAITTNQGIIELGKLLGITGDYFLKFSWPLSVEYLIFSVLFALFIWFIYKVDGLIRFSVSLFFLGAIGGVYMADAVYPSGAFTPFQALVPFTASSAEKVLNWMGYKTWLTTTIQKGVELPTLCVWENSHPVAYAIGWPCAGIQSLFIYTFTTLLFLKDMDMHTTTKAIYFVIGAVGTYIVNILRIVSIFLIRMHQGEAAAYTFHDFYGELYSMTWIILYLLIIFGSHKALRKLWGRVHLGVGD
ncbi:MAG: exosortase/archaeosortase family protein [Thermoproteota archaeon]|nr:exosortase/archaeosortase family protein [Thermoproteota archaeon]